MRILPGFSLCTFLIVFRILSKSKKSILNDYCNNKTPISAKLSLISTSIDDLTAVYGIGEKEGLPSPAGLFVSLACSEPSTFIIQISTFPSRPESKAILYLVVASDVVVSDAVVSIIVVSSCCCFCSCFRSNTARCKTKNKYHD